MQKANFFFQKRQFKLGHREKILFLQVVSCQINIFCHQLTQNTTTAIVRFTKIYTNCSKIQSTSFEILYIPFLCKICKSDHIGRHDLGWLVTKYVDLTKNNLYIHILEGAMKFGVKYVHILLHFIINRYFSKRKTGNDFNNLKQSLRK